MAFGIIAIVIMLCTMNMDYTDIWHYLLKVGIYFPFILALWLVVYLVNTLSWYLIINDEGRCEGLSFWRVYKLTVSGFALNYTTPCGLMGGEPYRIMELKPYTGVSKATSSVILYVMMHIFSHFWFWFLSIFLFIAFNPVGLSMGILLAVIGGFCFLGIYFFSRGYKTGMAQKGIRLLTHIPFVKGWALRFAESKKETLEQIDSQIALLHQQHKRTFYSSLLFELSARILQSFEMYLILKAHSRLLIAVQQPYILYADATWIARRRIGIGCRRTASYRCTRCVHGSYHPTARTGVDSYRNLADKNWQQKPIAQGYIRQQQIVTKHIINITI